MPLTPPGVTFAVMEAMVAAGFLGPDNIKLANAVGLGASSWIRAVTVSTADVGSLGVGAGLNPLVPPPSITSGLLASFSAAGLGGIQAPRLALALGSGLTLGFLQGVLVTQHPNVGVGTGLVSYKGASSIPFLIAAFPASGLLGLGGPKLAAAIGVALDQAFFAFTQPIAIVGSVSPSASSGVGTGQVILWRMCSPVTY